MALAGAIACAAPALAQTSAATIPPPPPQAEDSIGPPQLSNFSLNGTVTRRAEPQPERAQPRAEAPAASGTRAASAAPRQPETARERGSAQGASAAADSAGREPPAQIPAFDLPPPTPAQGSPLDFPTAAFGSDSEPSAPVDALAPASAEGGGLGSLLPWLAALLAAAAAAAWYFRRQRPGLALAGAGGNSAAFDLSGAPEPAPSPPAPPAPAPPPPSSGGIVSTRLRPWIDLVFSPDFAEIDSQRAVIHFEVTVFNSGSAPARDLLVEALLFNAGPDQDEAIGRFFDRPVGKGDTVPVLPPLQRMAFRHSVTLTRDQMRIFEVEGRKLFVPVIGFNALYGWSGGRGQTSMSYLIGRDTDGEKMAPFRADLGDRTFRGLAAREQQVRVRK